MRLIALILDPRTLRAILDSLGLRTERVDRAPPAYPVVAGAAVVPGSHA